MDCKFRLFFRKSGDPFSRARRITVLLNVVITCMACNAIFYHAKHSNKFISVGERFLVAFWSSLLIAPVNITVYLMLSKAGYRYPLLEVPMQNMKPPKPASFRPSKTLKHEQEELERQRVKHNKLQDDANNMTVDEAVEMGGVNRDRLLELVAQSKSELDSFEVSVKRRYDYEFDLVQNPPAPGCFTRFKLAVTGEWPWWMARVGYVFSCLVVIFSIYIILIYANNFTKAALNGWILSSAISIIQDILLNQPIASVGGAVFGVFLGTAVNKAISTIVGLIRGLM